MTDLDSDLRNRAVNFSIENGDHLHMFDIEKSEGTIIVQTPLDRETVSRICVRGSPMIPLVGNICTICTNFITSGIIAKEIGANGNNVDDIAQIAQILPMVPFGGPRTRCE